MKVTGPVEFELGLSFKFAPTLWEDFKTCTELGGESSSGSRFPLISSTLLWWHAFLATEFVEEMGRKWYVIVRGGTPGVYANWVEAEPHIDGLRKVSVWESFTTKEDARAVYDSASRKGFVHVVTANDFDSTSLSFLDDAFCDPLLGPWGHNVNTKWYIVVRGLVPGIYPTWIDAGTQVKGVFNALYQSASSRQDAIDIYKGRLAAGEVRSLAYRSASQTRHGACDRIDNGRFISSKVPVQPVNQEPRLLLDQLAESLRRVGITHSSPDTSTSYKTPGTARGYRSAEPTRPPQRISQHHSLPATRPTSPKKQAHGVVRSQSEGLARSYRRDTERLVPRQMESPSSSFSSNNSRNSGVYIGNPGHLSPIRSTAKVKRTPVAPDYMLSPIHHSDVPLSGIGCPRATTPSSSTKVYGVREGWVPQGSASASSYTPSRSTASSTSRYSSRVPIFSPATDVDSRGNGGSSPTINDHFETESGSSFTKSKSTTSRSSSRRFKSPALPFEGASCLGNNSPRGSPRKTSLSYSPERDARSPLRPGTVLPWPHNSISFGRPSPVAYPLAAPF